MTDIVERLRANYKDTDSSAEAHMALEAAAEIEGLRAEGCAPGQCKYGAGILALKDAEIERLQHENMRLQTDNTAGYDLLAGELVKRDAEIERLHAEIEARKTAAEKVYLEQAAEIERLNDALTDYHRVKALGRADAAENERLRAAVHEASRGGVETADLMQAEIERLRIENAELRKSLDTWIAIHGPREP